MDVGVAIVKTYLELCGYFVVTELPVRERVGDDVYRDVTDLDIVAVCFPRGPAARQSSRGALPSDLLLGLDPGLGAPADCVDLIIGEVKEGRARLNEGAHRPETIAFALRRVGCCPPEQVDHEAAELARLGERVMSMPGYTRCRTRIVIFAGRGDPAAHGLRMVPLRQCINYVVDRLRETPELSAVTQFKDPILGFLALQTKILPWAGTKHQRRSVREGRP